MFKNTASKFLVFAFDSTTNLPKTGDAANITAYVSKDFGAITVLADTTATELDATNAKGYYSFDAAQAETNADELTITAKSSTANIVVVGAPARISTFPQTGLLAPATLGRTVLVDASGGVAITTNLKKNQALANFAFLMTDSTNHNPATGKTVSVTRCIDGGTFGAGTLSAVTEVSNGQYRVDFGAGDLNGNVVTLKATATGCDDLFMTLILEP